MADSKATTRKKPVRKAPVQKDYPTKLDWLRAMTEYEEKQAEAETAAKLARLNKRIAVKAKAIAKLQAELDELATQRNDLSPETVEIDWHESENELGEIELDEPEAQDETA